MSETATRVRVVSWHRHHDIARGAAFVAIVLAAYAGLSLAGLVQPSSDPGLLDAIVWMILSLVIWFGIAKKLPVHRLMVRRGRVVYSVTVLGFPVRRRSLPLEGIESVRLGFEDASLESVLPGEAGGTERTAAESVLEQLVERRLVIEGPGGSLVVPRLAARTAHTLRNFVVAARHP